MNLLISVALLFNFCLVLTLEQKPEIINLKDNDEGVLESEVYESKDYLINLPFAHKLLIELDYVNIGRETADYLLIKRGPDLKARGTGIVITGNNIRDENPILISAETVLIRMHLGRQPKDDDDEEPPKRSFKLKYKVVGTSTVSTTTESPVSTSTWPTAGPDDEIHMQIHVWGRYDYEYNDVNLLGNLKIAISQMAKDYCKENNVPIKNTISSKNVIITDLMRCPYTWPASNDCVTVIFELPVVLEEGNEGYELLAKHLKVMWERHHIKLAQFKLKKYEKPDLNTQLTWWSVLLGVVIALFVAFTGAIICVRECWPQLFDRCGRNKVVDDIAPIIEDEQRQSVVSNLSQYNKFAENPDVIFINKNGTSNLPRTSEVSSSSG